MQQHIKQAFTSKDKMHPLPLPSENYTQCQVISNVAISCHIYVYLIKNLGVQNMVPWVEWSKCRACYNRVLLQCRCHLAE